MTSKAKIHTTLKQVETYEQHIQKEVTMDTPGLTQFK